MQALVRHRLPEELEYADYLSGIEARKRRIADLQATLELLKQALSRFELEYRARVGTIVAEMDRIRLSLAEYRRRIERMREDRKLKPADLEREVATEFQAQREEVDAEEEETRRSQAAFRRAAARPPLPPETDVELRRVYRELAKRFHPDLARDPDERTRRQEIMLRINAAFRERDLVSLRALANETAREDPTFEDRPLAQKLAWAIEESARLDGVIADLERQVTVMRHSDTYPMWATPEAQTAAIERLRTDAQSKMLRLREQLDRTIAVYLAIAGQRVR